MAPVPNSLSDVAATLAELKKLPLEQKARLLLGRLAKIGQHNESALNKHNLMLAGDPCELAQGYPESEKLAVREHLFGASWMKLVNEGYLVDLNGQGFYKVSDEGREFLNQEPTRVAPTPAAASIAAAGAPRALLSYSWDGLPHRDWVRELAARLRGESGVEIVFDQWHLNPGDDKLRFMEQAVTDSDFVIVVCTPNYAERANKREGGVGYESMVITAELAEHMHTNKFIPVLRDGAWSPSLPVYLKSRMGVNLSGNPYSEDEYEKLLRVLHGEPIQPPPIGKKPDFTKKPAAGIKGTSSQPAAAVSGVSTGSVSLLGPPEKRPNAVAHAQYDRPGFAGPWESAHVRIWDIDGEKKYSFETSRGDEHLGSKDEVIDRFFAFHRKLLKEGYKRMGFTPGPDPDFYVLS
jgi:hypothetical protein